MLDWPPSRLLEHCQALFQRGSGQEVLVGAIPQEEARTPSANRVVQICFGRGRVDAFAGLERMNLPASTSAGEAVAARSIWGGNL